MELSHPLGPRNNVKQTPQSRPKPRLAAAPTQKRHHQNFQLAVDTLFPFIVHHQFSRYKIKNHTKPWQIHSRQCYHPNLEIEVLVTISPSGSVN